MVTKTIKYALKIAVVLVLILSIGCSFLLSTSAASGNYSEVPYDSYTYWYNYNGSAKKATFSRAMYNLKKVVISSDLNIETNMEKLVDSVSFDGTVYLLDSQTPQIVMLNSDYSLKGVITSVLKEDSGEQLMFKSASGLFVNSQGIFIADTENKRILVCDQNGRYLREYRLPKSDLIPENFDYLPVRVSMDSRGYLYVLSDGCYEGAILYGPDGTFLGFYGSNKVAGNLATVLKNIYDSIFMTDAKKAASQRSLPYQFNDLFIDQNNFVYTSTGNTADSDETSTQKGQIKRMSPGGKNILNSENVDFTDVGISIANQNIVGLEVDEFGFIYAIDSIYGHIFVFDNECNMISCMGNGQGYGEQEGSFALPSSLCINGKDILVTDSKNNSLTIFSISSYGELVREAQSLTTKGNYSEAFPLWQKVIAQDSNSQVGYIGLGKGYYNEDNYKEAMYYSKLGCDRETYALAFGELRNKILKDNFIWIVLSILVILIVVSVLKRRFKFLTVSNLISKNYGFKTYLQIIMHPVASFREVKEKKCGSLIIAVVITILYYVTAVLSDMLGGFAFTYFDASTYNSFFVLLKTSGIILLFTVAFWCVSTLFGGLGRLKDVFIITAYSFTPVVAGNVISLILTNILVPSELGFLNVFISLTMIYTGILLMFGLIIINDFEFGRFVGVTVLSIIAMVIILFLGIVIIMLLQLCWGFAETIIAEIIKLFK